MVSAAIVPADAAVLADYRCLRVDGPVPLGSVGVLASLATSLARANVSVFPIATHDTDYLFVRDADLDAAIKSLGGALRITPSTGRTD